MTPQSNSNWMTICPSLEGNNLNSHMFATRENNTKIAPRTVWLKQKSVHISDSTCSDVRGTIYNLNTEIFTELL